MARVPGDGLRAFVFVGWAAMLAAALERGERAAVVLALAATVTFFVGFLMALADLLDAKDDVRVMVSRPIRLAIAIVVVLALVGATVSSVAPVWALFALAAAAALHRPTPRKLGILVFAAWCGWPMLSLLQPSDTLAWLSAGAIAGVTILLGRVAVAARDHIVVELPRAQQRPRR